MEVEPAFARGIGDALEDELAQAAVARLDALLGVAELEPQQFDFVAQRRDDRVIRAPFLRRVAPGRRR